MKKMPRPKHDADKRADVDPGVRSASSSQHEAGEAFKSAIGIPENAEHEEDAPYPGSGAAEDLLPPPDFRPFFTLIEDSATGDYHHPTVHYIFSDDDADDLTNAMLAAIEQQARSSTDAQAETEERMLLLEVTPDGKAITSAASLHPRWQALKVNVAQAPSWGGASAEGGDGRLMLTISGHEAESESRAEGLTAVEDLVKTFNEQVESLDEIVGKHGETTAMPDDTTADRDE